MSKLLSIICFIFLTGCAQSQSCASLPSSFISYSQAIEKIKSSTFRIRESTDVSASSWITSADYYSCEGKTGFFIYTTDRGNQYIHQEVPIAIWEGFKNASSKGSFYNENIKGRYRLKLN